MKNLFSSFPVSFSRILILLSLFLTDSQALAASPVTLQARLTNLYLPYKSIPFGCFNRTNPRAGFIIKVIRQSSRNLVIAIPGASSFDRARLILQRNIKRFPNRTSLKNTLNQYKQIRKNCQAFTVNAIPEPTATVTPNSSRTPTPTSTRVTPPTPTATPTRTIVPTIPTGCSPSRSIGQIPANSIWIDSSKAYQTMRGWEANAQSGHAFPYFSKYKDELLNRAVNELGISRIRLEVTSGIENPVDAYAQFKSGQISEDTYVDQSYQIVNDDQDPNHINPAGFHFSAIDDAIDNVVLPLKQRLGAVGKSLYVNLNYVDFRDSAFEHREEYAELMVAVFQHIKARYGFVPDGIEITLEPDNTPWTGTSIGKAIVATANRFRSSGITVPDFIAPSTTLSTNAVRYFSDLSKVPDAAALVRELSYHRYDATVTSAVLKQIASKANEFNIATSMLEQIGADANSLYQDLTLANVSAWQQFTLAYPGNDDGATYFPIDASSTASPKVTMGSITKRLSQFFFYIRAGALRIDASSNTNGLSPVAFINPDCKYVMVINRKTGGAFNVLGLPGGTYGVSYSSSDRFRVTVPDIVIATDQTLSVSLPDSVEDTVTLFQR